MTQNAIPDRTRVAVHYQGGKCIAPLGIMKLLFSNNRFRWRKLTSLIPGRSRNRYGFRRKTNAMPGQPVQVTFANGDTWTVRVVGPVQRFIDEVLEETGKDTILEISTARSKAGRTVAEEIV